MAPDGNGMSDKRIGEALIQEVILEELSVLPAENIPPLSPMIEQNTAQEKKMVSQLTKMVRIIGDRVKGDEELKDAIDGVAACGSVAERFREVANNVFHDGITWERIAVLFYVAGKLSLKMVEAHIPQSVTEILTRTVVFFRNNLLGWIRDHGGWINSFSELAAASVQNVSTMTSHPYGFVLIFLAGLTIGSLITWRLTQQS